MAKAGPKFTHLHVHSEYSLLDGACRIRDMVNRAKELGQDSLAITDHGCLFGVVSFYNAAVTAGVKPIVGIEAYMAPNGRTDRTATGIKDGGYHLLLLAQNHAGYRNLLKLGSIAYVEGFYYKPRIDKEVLRAHSEGLVCTSACLGGEIPGALMQSDRKKAKVIAETYIEIFGPDRFFIELQKHIPEQDQVNPELIDLADRLGVGTVATNDVHFLAKDDHAHHDALCCISTGKLISDESRMKYPTQLYMKSTEEMYAAMDHPKWAEACANTNRIAEMCELELDFAANHAPVVKIVQGKGLGPGAGGRGGGSEAASPWDKKDVGEGKADGARQAAVEGSTEWFKQYCSNYHLLPFDVEKDRDLTPEVLKEECDLALRELCAAGMIWRYGRDGITEAHRARLERELQILADKNISAYFLIVWDFVNEARRRGIPSSARGSGVGTMVGYVLGLSNACPIQYGLLFERFTDPDRSEYPDIDIDICQDGRQEIIDYVREKYGHVAQIITFGTLKARAAIRDVGRVNNMPLPVVDQLCKLIGDGLGTTIDKALQQEPDLRKLYEEDPQVTRVIDTARKLEGLSRHAGVHAAGVVVATQPLSNIVPLAVNRQGNKEVLVTQWDGPTVEKVGLLKMDFLGLRTHSIIERARQLIAKSFDEKTIRLTVAAHARYAAGPAEELHGPDWDPLDLDRLRFDDQTVLDLFRRGETAGVFQFESGGMRNTLMGIKPDRLEDLIAANALFRPGPMELIPDYNDRKHGRAKVPAAHAIVEKFTGETYGIMIYQEQVMQIVHELGDIPLRQAYTLIKAISKKKEKVINANRDQFINGANEKGVAKTDADELFNLILKFAGYGFNKSHSTGYAILAYQTAYLKTYFPVQYMAALLTYESISTDKVVEYIDECKRVQFVDGHRGIPVRPPDINLSDIAFTDVFEKDEPRNALHGHIRFGLNAVKGVGEKAIAGIIAEREKAGPFRSMFDFCERVPPGIINKSVLEALIKCGAFDSVHGADKRAAMVESIEEAMGRGAQEAALRSSEDFLFGAVAMDDTKKATATVAEPSLANVPAWSSQDQLKHEQSVLGLFLSSHPLDEYADLLERCTNATIGEALELAAGTEVIIGGMLSRVRPTFVKNGRSAGQKMAMIKIEDHRDAIEGVIFSDTYAIAAPLVENDRIVILKGKIDRRRESPNIIVNEVIAIERAAERLTQGVKIVLDPRRHRDARALNSNNATGYNGELTQLRELLRQSSAGNGEVAADVYLEIHENNNIVHLRVNGLRVAANTELPQRIETILKTPRCCQLLGPRKLRNHSRYAAMRHNDSQPVEPKIHVTASHEEVCASVDRY